MSQTNKIYLSQIPDIFSQTFSTLEAHGSAYFSAPCGSGKTQFAKNIIRQFQQRTNCEFSQIIYLIDTVNGKSQLVQSETSMFTDSHAEWHKGLYSQVVFEGGFVHNEINMPPEVLVLTYSRFIQILKSYSVDERDRFYSTIKLIIADEPHRLSDFSRWSYGKADKQAEYAALRSLIFNRTFNSEHFKLVAMSATFNPSDLLPITHMQIDTSVAVGWLTESVVKIKNINTAISHVLSLKAQSKPYRTVVYASLISNMQLYEKQFTLAGLNTACIWSPHADKHMSIDQQYVLNTIVKSHMVPDAIEVLIINASTETSVNLNNPDFDVFVGMVSNMANIVQARGRIRKDISYGFLYDENGLSTLEHKQLTTNEVRESLPPEYLNIDIDKDKLQILATQVNLRGKDRKLLKWPSIKLYYEALGYTCTSSRKQINGVRDTYYKFTI